MRRSRFEDVTAALREPGMGTEYVGPLLECLVLLTRPRVVVEVGAGYTTPYLLRGLTRSAADQDRDAAVVNRPAPDAAARDRRDLLVPHRVSDQLDPVLVTIDDLSDGMSSARRVLAAVDQLGLASRLRFVERDFRGAAEQIGAEYGPIDLVWFDAGGAAEAADLLAEFWPMLRAGGLVVMHGSYWTVPVTLMTGDGPTGGVRTVPGAVANEVKRQLAAAGLAARFEALNLVEPHKQRQNSVLLLRRCAGTELTRDVLLRDELAVLGLADADRAGFTLQ